MINTATGTRNERKPPRAERDNMIVFPKIIITNKKLLFILKKLKVKIVYICTERHIFTTSILSNNRWKETLLRFGQKDIEKCFSEIKLV